LNLQLLLIAMVCGAFQAMQALTNGSAAQAGLGAIWVGAISASVSAVSLALFALLVQQAPSPAWSLVESQGPKALLGGLMGAVILSGLTFVTPKLGPAQTFLFYFGVIVAVSLLVERFGLFGLQSRDLRPQQLVGVGLAAAGLLLTRI
jgi:bacterial/archaeal transporter family-2 protein